MVQRVIDGKFMILVPLSTQTDHNFILGSLAGCTILNLLELQIFFLSNKESDKEDLLHIAMISRQYMRQQQSSLVNLLT